MSKPRRQSHSQNSQFEKSFILGNAFKRNKRYIDYKEINKAHKQMQTSRRRPFSSSEKSIDEKITHSFLNTTTAFSDKLEYDIGKFKLRMTSATGNDITISHDQTQTSRSFSTKSFAQARGPRSARSFDEDAQQKKRIPGMAIDKYCSRQQYYRAKNKPVPDQRLFNNYSEQKPDQKHIRDFAKYQSREHQFSQINSNQLQYDTQKLYQDCFYNQTNMQCSFKYKKGDKTGREFFVVRKKENQPATELSRQKVNYSYQKCSTTGIKNIDCFYSNTGRQLPSQLDMRLNNNLTNQWVDDRGRVKRKTKDYSLRKMKNDLVEKKIEEINTKKKPLFERKQLCDSMYFRVHPIS